jgi:hypothetical protein
MQTIPVNSGVPQDATIPSSSPRRIADRAGQTSWRNLPEQPFSFLPRTRAFRFSSQENFFSAIKNKIHFFLVDFETGF